MSEAHGLPEPPSRQAVGFALPLIWRAAFTQPWSPAQIGSSQRLSRWLPDHLNRTQPRRRADHQIAAKLTAGVDLDLRPLIDPPDLALLVDGAAEKGGHLAWGDVVLATSALSKAKCPIIA